MKSNKRGIEGPSKDGVSRETLKKVSRKEDWNNIETDPEVTRKAQTGSFDSVVEDLSIR